MIASQTGLKNASTLSALLFRPSFCRVEHCSETSSRNVRTTWPEHGPFPLHWVLVGPATTSLAPQSQ